jgi:DNA polymerase (family 10)
MTDRIISALENKFVDILGHPTAYYKGDFKAINANWNKIFDVAAQNKKILEINSQPNRLDLNEKNIKKAKEYGVKFSISTDAHSREELGFIVLGVNLANRAGLTTADVVNSLPISELKRVFTRIPESL